MSWHKLSDRWIEYGFALAAAAANASKDPSTKVGAVIMAPDKTIVSTGFNGFPRGMDDDVGLYKNREEKYKRIIHAEMNAILVARRSLVGCALFVTPLMCCPRCAVHIGQAGISAVFAKIDYQNPEQAARWVTLVDEAHELLFASGVNYVGRWPTNPAATTQPAR